MVFSKQHTENRLVLPTAILICFFNSFLLPEGLTLTLLLTPVWVYILYNNGTLHTALYLSLPLLVYMVIHLWLGVVISYYFVSLTMIGCMVFFLVTAYQALCTENVNWDRLFRLFAIANFLGAVASLLLLGIPGLKEMVWYMVPISNNIKPVPRLKLFAPEASHFSFWMAPIAIYFFTRAFLFPAVNKWFTLFVVCFPLALSFSLGVIGGIVISGIPVLLYYGWRKWRHQLLNLQGAIWIGAVLVSMLALYRFFPDNPLFARLRNIATGSDTSANGRTFQAFELAHRIIAQKSYWFGIGPGQLKILGRQIIIQYYNYITVPKAARIPNACAETIVYFGYIGFVLRMAAEVVLFFTTRVYKSPFRLWIFLFVFLYQFTGSYITNIAEYLVWMLAFIPIFPGLEYAGRYKKLRMSAFSSLLQPATL